MTAVRQRRDHAVGVVLTLTFSTGIVDAVSYVSLDHVFTANMSGNIALLGVGLADDLEAVYGNAFAFGGFVAGSVLIARFLRGCDRTAMRDVSQGLMLELLFLLAVATVLAAVDTTTHDGWRYVVCALLAAAMGIQTGLARRLSVTDVNTTVATMTLHDLAAASRAGGGDSQRWRRRAAVIVALLVGAAVGVALDQIVRFGGISLSCLLVAATIVVLAGVRRATPPALS